MADDPDLTGHVRLDLTELFAGLRRAQTESRRQIRQLVGGVRAELDRLDLSRLSAGMARVGSLIGGLSRLAVPFAAAGAAIGSLVPLIAGLATALAQLAPAAALAVSGVLAIGLAAGTLKLAMSGVGDAATAALEPSDPEAYAEALKKLSPNARSFVEEIRKAQPALDKIRKTVQDRVFEGLDTQLRTTATAALPELRTALNSTATTLNQMAAGVLTAARGLAQDGTLGTALKGATAGLAAFREAPGQVVTALGQIGAAAAPAFQRLSEAGAGALDRLSAKLTASFESGGMEEAINTAIDLFAQLGRVAGNIGGIFSNVFGGLTSQGQGLFSTLETITGSLREATASAGFQRALAALSQTMGVVATTVGPLLGQALSILGPVIEQLAGPAQQLVRVLGDALGQVMTALGPVLESAAGAFGDLVVALLPLIELGGQLIAAVLPALVPLFDSLSAVFVQLAPVIAAVAETVAAALVPLLSSLGPILEKILPPFVELAAQIFPLLADILVQLTPGLTQLATSFADLMVQLAPLGVILTELAGKFLAEVLPSIGPVLVGAVTLLSQALSFFADLIEGTVMPIVKGFAALLRGDMSGAAGYFTDAAENARDLVSRAFFTLASNGAKAVNDLGAKVRDKAAEMRDAFVQKMGELKSQATAKLNALPGELRGALGNAGTILQSAGQQIIQGLINGINSKIYEVRSKLQELTASIPDWKGPKRRDATLLTPAGKSIIRGLIDGIDASTASLKSKLGSVTNLIERAISVNKSNRSKVSGLGSLLARVGRDNKALLGLAATRDKIATRLKAAQKRLDDAIAARTKAAASIRDGILGDANITSGNTVVNSVAAITIGLQQAVAKTKAFAANLAALKKAGLRSDLLGDIGEAGVDGGSATAAALAKATPAELAKINALQGQLVSAATSTGNSVAGALYDSGVKAAQGLVDGLKKQQGAIEKQMTKIATAMVKALKKALDMHSPSRKLRAVASLAMEGMPQGFEAMRTRVARSAASVANAAVTAAQTVASVRPSIPAPGALTAAYAGSQGGGDTHHTWNLYGSDATPDGILHALSWQGLVGRRG